MGVRFPLPTLLNSIIMLFKDILNSKTEKLQPEFDKLFDDILNKQTHDGDLLLCRVNGFYNPEVYSWTNIEEKLSPYMIGPNKEGHSDYRNPSTKYIFF